MKKIICILILAVLYFQKFDYVDLSKYQSKWIKVEIKGEVKHPDVYTLPIKSSIKELIDKAQGITSKADTSILNLNQKLMDGDVVVILAKKEIVKVSINSASVEELMNLPGIGISMANRIIEYRNTYRFKTLEDIMLVKGIKEKLFTKIKDRISL